MTKTPIDSLLCSIEKDVVKAKDLAQLTKEQQLLRKVSEDNTVRVEAENILNTIPSLIEKALQEGKRSVVVMKIDDYSHHENWFDKGRWHVSIIGGPGIIVLDSLKTAKNLNVELRHNHDGVGIRSWAEIVISW